MNRNHWRGTNRVLKTDHEFNLSNARQIIDTRNWLIHIHDKVDDVVILGIISNHLPNLKREIEEYLKVE